MVVGREVMHSDLWRRKMLGFDKLCVDSELSLFLPR